MSGERVLVTGGSGFIAVHCILRLLKDGYRVRTTVRSSKREAEVREMLRSGGADAGRLEFAEADLTSDAGWPAAVAGCTYVLHVASPFPSHIPKSEQELIVPAREGALRVLRAAREEGVRRVVLTSSFAAIGYGRTKKGASFDESDWTDPTDPTVAAYARSKTLAERAAWDFMAREGGPLELAVVNPVAVFGPTLGRDYSTSLHIIKLMLERALPAVPRVWFGVVDVRDVADLHLRAMVDPAARGERFLASAGDFITFRDIALILKSGLGAAGARVPTREMPDWLMRVAALFNGAAALAVPELGSSKTATSAKARRVLGWKPRPAREALIASAESLIAFGVVKL